MTDLRPVIFSALCACLDLSPDSEEALRTVREAYTEPENTPRPPRDWDVLYWHLTEDSSAKVINPSYIMSPAPVSGMQIPVIHTTVAATLLLVFYGPNSAENAHKVRLRLYLDGAGSPRAILRAAGVSPVPQPSEPLILADQEGSLWRSRADLRISLSIHYTVSGPQRNAVVEPPVVTITIG